MTHSIFQEEKGFDLRGEKALECGGIVSLTFSYDGVDPMVIFEQRVRLNATVPEHCREIKSDQTGRSDQIRQVEQDTQANQSITCSKVDVIKEDLWIQVLIFVSFVVVVSCTLFESIRMNHSVKKMNKSAMD